jgi:glycosyltransferase involved in cell wall biosynthesis
MHVAEPGADPAALAAGSESGGALLCVAAVTRDKGHDVLLEALADLHCSCTCVGSLDRDPAFAATVQRRAQGLPVSFTGPRTGAELDRAYAEADLLVLASHAETYGMVVTEALARGISVVAPAVGGVPETLGRTAGGDVPGMLFPPGDARALARTLRRWFGEPELRHRLRRAARERREELAGWETTAAAVARVLDRLRSAA